MSNKISPVKYDYYEEEIDLKELLAIVIREKIVVIATIIIISLISSGVAIYLDNKNKVATTIITTKNDFANVKELKPNGVLASLYREYNLKSIGVNYDSFKESFKIEPIIPNNIKVIQKLHEKNGKAFKYIPDYYEVSLRVGSIELSKKILESYVIKLNNDVKLLNMNKKVYKAENLENLSKYDYFDSLDIISDRLGKIEEELNKKISDFNQFGTMIRDLNIKIDILEKVDIPNLRYYLETNGIVKNTKFFKDSYISRMKKLETNLKNIQYKKAYLEKLMKEFEIENNVQILDEKKESLQNFSVNIEKEKQYTTIINQYITTQTQLGIIEKKIAELKLLNDNLKDINKDNLRYVERRFYKILSSYNSIVDGMNLLIKKENEVNYGTVVRKMIPVTAISTSKTTLILGVGIILGIFLGIMMAFIKNFIIDLKKYISISTVVLFISVGLNSHGQEAIMLSISQDSIEQGLNPDGTNFNLNNEINEYLSRYYDIKNIKIGVEPFDNSILNSKSITKVKKNIENNSTTPGIIPVEYKIIIEAINEKEIAELLEKEFNKFYSEKIKPKMERFNFNNRNFNDTLKEMEIVVNTLREELNTRLKDDKTKHKAELNSILLSLNRLQNTYLRDLNDYIYSNGFVINLKEGKAFVIGEKNDILREKKRLNDKAIVLSNVIDIYKLPLVGRGEDSIRDKQYVEISTEYLKIQNRIVELTEKEEMLELLSKNMKFPSNDELVKIDNFLNLISKDINRINEELYEVLLSDFR